MLYKLIEFLLFLPDIALISILRFNSQTPALRLYRRLLSTELSSNRIIVDKRSAFGIEDEYRI